MYVAVASAILGQALIFGNLRLLAYGGLAWLLFHLFVLAYEEPALKASFGPEYESLCSEVPRWVPRFTLPEAGAEMWSDKRRKRYPAEAAP
jgi:protein-S-isoprenylcysteine O-methyltransferase Ste14